VFVDPRVQTPIDQLKRIARILKVNQKKSLDLKKNASSFVLQLFFCCCCWGCVSTILAHFSFD
jgi:hypothetical protein